jgi:hypothetical protein
LPVGREQGPKQQNKKKAEIRVERQHTDRFAN